MDSLAFTSACTALRRRSLTATRERRSRGDEFVRTGIQPEAGHADFRCKTSEFGNDGVAIRVLGAKNHDISSKPIRISAPHLDHSNSQHAEFQFSHGPGRFLPLDQ